MSCLVIDWEMILIIFRSKQKFDIVFYFLNRKFLQMFLNNLNFFLQTRTGRKCTRKSCFQIQRWKAPATSVTGRALSPLLALTPSASFRALPRDQSLPGVMIGLKEEDQITSRICRTFSLILLYKSTHSMSEGEEGKTRKKNSMS